MTEAGRVLGVSERQTFRIKARVKKGGHKVNPNRLEQTLCFKYQRVVAKDNTVRFEASLFQIPKRSPYLSYATKKVQVNVLWDGSVKLFYKGEPLIQPQDLGRNPLGHRLDFFRAHPVIEELPDESSKALRDEGTEGLTAVHRHGTALHPNASRSFNNGLWVHA